MLHLHRLSLRATVAALLVLAFLVMSAIYYYQADISRRALVREVTAQLLHDVRLMKAHHEMLIKNVGDLLAEMVYDPPPGADADGCRRWLAHQLKRNSGLGEVGVALPSGEVVCASDDMPHVVSIADRDYFRHAVANRDVVVTELVSHRSGGAAAVVSAIAAHDSASGVPRAVFFVALDIGRLVHQFLGSQQHFGRLLVQDDQGNVLARYPDVENLAGTNRAASPLFATVKRHDGEGAVELPGLDGTPTIYIYTTLQETTFGKLYLIYAVPKAQAEAAAQKPFYVTLSVGAAALVVLMLGVYYGGDRLFLRRIARLNQAVENLARGNLAARTGVHDAGDEIGRLASSFDSMAATIQRKDDEISRVARALRVVSSGNRCMLHATSENELYEHMCRAVVTSGGYHLACVGLLDDSHDGTLRATGFFGPDQKFLGDWQKVWDENHPDGIARDAIGRREAVVARHIASQEHAPWRRAIAERYGYQSLAALPLTADGKVIGVLMIAATQPDAFDEEEMVPLRELAGDISYGMVYLRTRNDRDRIAYAHRHHEVILRQALAQTVQTIAATVEMRDPYTAGHQRRVAQLASAIARSMQLSEERVEGLHFAAILHDLGKITIPAEILAKPTELSDIELMFVRTHPKAGHDILKDVSFPWPIADIILQHHERLDGSGYPNGLTGNQLLLESRILAVADTVEAMMSHRPYRASLGVDAALAHIRAQAGVTLDKAATEACLKLFEEGGFSFDA